MYFLELCNYTCDKIVLTVQLSNYIFTVIYGLSGKVWIRKKLTLMVDLLKWRG